MRPLNGGRFLMPEKEAVFMWNVVACFLCFLAGTVAGVMLMCLLQAGRKVDADKTEGM